MVSLEAIVVGALTDTSASTRRSMSVQTASGNVGLSSGEIFSPGEVDCRGDTEEALFYAFEYILDILVLVVILRTLWFATMLMGRPATAILVWARERSRGFVQNVDGASLNKIAKLQGIVRWGGNMAGSKVFVLIPRQSKG